MNRDDDKQESTTTQVPAFFLPLSQLLSSETRSALKEQKRVKTQTEAQSEITENSLGAADSNTDSAITKFEEIQRESYYYYYYYYYYHYHYHYFYHYYYYYY